MWHFTESLVGQRMLVKETRAEVFLTGRRVYDGSVYIYETDAGNFLGEELCRVGSI